MGIYIVIVIILILWLVIGASIGYGIAESKYRKLMCDENRRFQRILDEQVSMAKRGLI